MHHADLVWVTPNAEQLIGDIARVSNPANQGSSPDALIRYLIANKHWSPFEMVSLCVEVSTTRTIGRQWLRHGLRPQEFSQRYAKTDLLGDFVYSPARLQDDKNRQNSVIVNDAELSVWWLEQQKAVAAISSSVYKQALAKGIAKELARNILPEGMTPTKMYFQGNLRDFLFATETRRANGTQREAITIADDIYVILNKEFPVTSNAFFNREK